MSPVRRARDRGAIVVEAALLMPLLILMFMGIVEYGIVYQQANSASTGVGAAAQAIAREPDERLADFHALQQIRTVFTAAELTANVKWVMVYKTSDSAGAPPAACVTAATALTSGSTGVSGQCNIYAGPTIASYTTASFQSATCAAEPDSFFCPTNRSSVVGTAHMGVAIRFRQPWRTGILPGGGVTITDRSVIVPDFYGS